MTTQRLQAAPCAPRTMTTVRALSALVAALLIPAVVHAQRVTPITAGAGPALARGAEGALLNPALLALEPRREVIVAGAQGGVQSDAFSWQDYTRYNGKTWTDSDKNAILDRIGPDGVTVGADAGLAALAVSYGRWAFATHTQAMGTATLAQDAARLLLLGNVENETFSLNGTAGDGLAWSSVQVGYGAPIGDGRGGWQWTAGATAKYVKGWGYARILEAAGDLTTTIEGTTGSGRMTVRTAEGGSGYSLDLGIAARSGPRRYWSLALCDALSRVSWSKNPQFQYATFTALDTPLVDADNSDDLVADSTWSVPTTGFDAALPRLATLATAFPLGRADAATSLSYRFGSGVAARARAAVGLVFPLSGLLSLGGGVSVGGIEESSAVGGLTLRTSRLRADLALASRGTPLFWQARGYGVSLGLGFSY